MTHPSKSFATFQNHAGRAVVAIDRKATLKHQVHDMGFFSWLELVHTVFWRSHATGTCASAPTPTGCTSSSSLACVAKQPLYGVCESSAGLRTILVDAGG